MKTIAAVISWDGDSSARSTVERMLDAVPHRGRHHVLSPEPGVFLAVPEAENEPGQLAAGPWAAIDARLDNRTELCAELQNTALTNKELLALGYQRWDTDLANHLVGDFALAVWAPGQRTLYAARDPFGARPLYYSVEPRRLMVASEIEQLVAARNGSVRINERVVLDYLLGEHRHPDETFFHDIFRVKPGHWLLAGRDSHRHERWWHPPREVLRFADHAECLREFRRLFQAAVADRFKGGSVVAHLSGGIDSAAIVCKADDILRHRNETSSVHAVSALFPGLDCDEEHFIQAVAQRITLPTHRENATTSSFLAEPQSGNAHPWGGPWLVGFDGDLRLAKQLGSAGILSGFGGDELLFERGVFRDLAAHGRLLSLLRQTVLAPGFYSSQRPRFFLMDALRSCVPAFLRRARRRWQVPSASMPAWLGPRLRAICIESAPSPEPPAEHFRDWTQQFTWQWLSRPDLWWSIEAQVGRAARWGLEMRYPFLDRRLAEFIMALPYEHRLPGGRMKAILRDALSDLVPQAILDRTGVTAFDGLLALEFQRNRSWFQAMFQGESWLSASFVDQHAVSKIATSLDKDEKNNRQYTKLALLRAVAHLELWIRALHLQGAHAITGTET